MVKLATAREARLYGPALTVRRWEYINAGAYVFGTLLLAAGLAAVCASSDGGVRAAGLVVAAAALVIVAAVNAHDLGAHLAGVDCRVGLVRFDPQLALVELLVPALNAAGCVLAIVGVAFLLSQSDGRERHAASTMLAGALLWLLGSALNACQVYERADGRAQLLQSSVQVPVLVGSLLFLVAAVLNRRDPVERWTMCLCGSVLWLLAALFNVVKVFMMHQSDAPRLEKLRGGAQEWLSRDREGRVPLVWRSAAPPTELR
ncbi:uncharacterized protein LOC124708164 [Lolium rigidum]|uniref:uncharacterized protein LOC124708164 n=1 Tax=Lolium rigidum TaxID=89674 RepID=UPI001F5DBD8C|nr:uncharacterized protein LOC124708164 [Lolium rigidum]